MVITTDLILTKLETHCETLTENDKTREAYNYQEKITMTVLDVTANLVHRQVTATWPPHGLWRQVRDPLVTLSLTGGTN